MFVHLVQLNSSANRNDNLAAIEQLLADAMLGSCVGEMHADKSAQADNLVTGVPGVASAPGLIVLPENFAVMGVDRRRRYDHAEIYTGDTDLEASPSTSSNQNFTPSSPATDQRIGTIQNWLSRLAVRYNSYVVGGTVPIKAADHLAPRVYASSLVYSPQGNCIARYDKRHLFDVDVAAADQQAESYRESAAFVAGDDIQTFTIHDGEVQDSTNPTNLGDSNAITVGLSVCYDLRFPEHFRAVAADIWLVPSAFTYRTGQAHWQTLLAARAIENQAHVIGVNQCGQHADGRETWGHSMVLDDWGNCLGSLQHEPSVLSIELDLGGQAQRRREFPVLQHRR